MRTLKISTVRSRNRVYTGCEKNYTINLLLDVFKEDEYVEPEEEYRDIDLEERY